MRNIGGLLPLSLGLLLFWIAKKERDNPGAYDAGNVGLFGLIIALLPRRYRPAALRMLGAFLVVVGCAIAFWGFGNP